MRIVFISNFLNHHQLPLIRSLQVFFDEVKFISTEKIPDERLQLGYDEMTNYDFLIDVTDQRSLDIAMSICSDFEIAIIGSAPDSFIYSRLTQNKITFRYMERLFKQTDLLAFHPNMLRSILTNHAKFRNKNLYLLCAGHKVKRDFSIYGVYQTKSYKWGYFPEFIEYSKDMLIRSTDIGALRLTWIGRFLDWKHPEKIINVARYLKKRNVNFNITMIGTGPLLEDIKIKISKSDLEDSIHTIGALNHKQVRNHLLQSDVFIFTSDRNEGWGAVLNEAMNSACLVIANKSIGSTGYLIEHGVNGLLYGNDLELFDALAFIIDNPSKRQEMGLKAYETIAEIWNSNVAAKHLYLRSKSLIEKKPIELIGPGSPA